jgi:hypothetical protein
MVIYVDIDDTLVRSVGSRRVPMPAVVLHVRELYEQGAELYCWSSGGAEYARQSADELGLTDCFAAFLPKPQVMLDDQNVGEWRGCITVHPASCTGQTVDDYQRTIVGAHFHS